MTAAGPQGLEAFLVRPAAAGRYPLALISHGSPRNVADRAAMSARSLYPIALEFARRGFASLVVMRRGYGTSPGGMVDSYGSCDHPAYLSAVKVAVADLRAAVRAMNNRADVTVEGMIAVGHSAGGLATVGLTAQAPSGLAAAISFAGGRGSVSENSVCGEQVLVHTFGELGQSSRTPMLWVYASNDQFFRPQLAHQFYDAFQAGGGRAKFVDAPAFGRDGHLLFSASGRPQWTPLVDDFLREQKLGLRKPLPVPAPLRPQGQLKDAGRQAFAQFASKMLHKAFATSPTGAFGWRTGMSSVAEARSNALAACAKWAKDCTVYAIDDELVRDAGE